MNGTRRGTSLASSGSRLRLQGVAVSERPGRCGGPSRARADEAAPERGKPRRPGPRLLPGHPGRRGGGRIGTEVRRMWMWFPRRTLGSASRSAKGQTVNVFSSAGHVAFAAATRLAIET